MTDELGFVHAAGDDAAAVSALLGRPVTVRARVQVPQPPTDPAQTVRDCRQLLHQFAQVPIELVTGPPGRQTSEMSTALAGQPYRWFVRLTPMSGCVAVQPLGVPDGASHVTLDRIAWVRQPGGDLPAAVLAAAERVRVYRQAAASMPPIPLLPAARPVSHRRRTR